MQMAVDVPSLCWPPSCHHVIQVFFSVLYYNARSLLPKPEELKANCLTHKPDIICVVETWLDETITDNELSLSNYDIVCLDHNRHGGGILIYVNSCFSYSLVFSGTNDLEVIVLTINDTITLGLFYRPPISQSSILINLLTVLCSHINISLLSNFILLGDFNVNVLNSSYPLYSKLQFLSSSLCLTQIVT